MIGLPYAPDVDTEASMLLLHKHACELMETLEPLLPEMSASDRYGLAMYLLGAAHCPIDYDDGIWWAEAGDGYAMLRERYGWLPEREEVPYQEPPPNRYLDYIRINAAHTPLGVDVSIPAPQEERNNPS